MSAEKVISVLNARGAEYRSVCGEALVRPIKSLHIGADKIDIELSNGDFVSQIDAIWFRRGFYDFRYDNIDMVFDEPEVAKQIEDHLISESNTLLEFFLYLLGDKAIGSQLNYNQNKLIALKVATAAGFKVPNTYISSGEHLSNYAAEFRRGELITKNIQDILVLNRNGSICTHETNKVETGKIANCYGYSLLQDRVYVKYEFRVFVFMAKIYAIACINDSENKHIDIRNRQNNRYTICELPTEVEQKILLTMDGLNLQTGSLDILLDGDDNWWFLEINPVGQFDMMYTYGHIDIYGNIAEQLISMK